MLSFVVSDPEPVSPFVVSIDDAVADTTSTYSAVVCVNLLLLTESHLPAPSGSIDAVCSAGKVFWTIVKPECQAKG